LGKTPVGCEAAMLSNCSVFFRAAFFASSFAHRIKSKLQNATKPIATTAPAINHRLNAERRSILPQCCCQISRGSVIPARCWRESRVPLATLTGQDTGCPITAFGHDFRRPSSASHSFERHFHDLRGNRFQQCIDLCVHSRHQIGFGHDLSLRLIAPLHFDTALRQ
jgi:hypothetical protein